MKKQTGIWIDTSRAIIVTLSGGKEHVTEIESDIENRIYHQSEGDKGTFMGSSHISNEKSFDERKKNQIDKFLTQVLEQIINSDELYVFGPAEIKLKLKDKIGSNGKLSTKLKSVETADSMTLNQVVAKVKEFFSIDFRG
ncbi:MAG: hypothetical protein JNM78_12605 [Cyclobacteriaceae bacterium]|nr:hypothetical protein [Cyclobacteriaceae bacterium]